MSRRRRASWSSDCTRTSRAGRAPSAWAHPIRIVGASSSDDQRRLWPPDARAPPPLGAACGAEGAACGGADGAVRTAPPLGGAPRAGAAPPHVRGAPFARAAPHPRVATLVEVRARHDAVEVAREAPLHVPVVCADCARGDCIGDWARAGEPAAVWRTGAKFA